MWNELADSLRILGMPLGFADDQIAWAYCGCVLASLLCVIYGLITWNRDEEFSRARRSRRESRVKQDRRPRRRR
jgi:hypothetical protein